MAGTDGMRAWAVTEPGPVDGAPLIAVTRPVPVPAGDEVLLRVRACGVCRTDLHVVEGDLAVHRPHVVPGHEIVGQVEAVGRSVVEFAPGDRIGVARKPKPPACGSTSNRMPSTRPWKRCGISRTIASTVPPSSSREPAHQWALGDQWPWSGPARNRILGGEITRTEATR